MQKGDEIFAAMPYVVRKRYGFTTLGQPHLTQTLGPWLREVNAKPAQKLAQQKEWFDRLIEQLPPFDHFVQNWKWNNTNWLPFYWKKFRQTTRYTYILHDICNQDLLWRGFQENIRREIKKASSRFSLRVKTDLGIDDFLRLNSMTFKRQNMKIPYSAEFVRNLDKICLQNASRKILIAEDDQGRQHAGVYIVWDKNSAYYLMGGGDPALRSSGATSLCMWEAIKFASTVSHKFDFEGSMIEPVEKFFRAFGAEQTPYFSITKTPSRLLKTALFLRELKAGR